VLAVSDNVIAFPTPRGLVLHDVERDKYFKLNAIGALVWNYIDGSRDVEEIVEAVYTQIINPPETINEDVQAFISTALELGVICKI